jgi:hypothetical protein
LESDRWTAFVDAQERSECHSFAYRYNSDAFALIPEALKAFDGVVPRDAYETEDILEVVYPRMLRIAQSHLTDTFLTVSEVARRCLEGSDPQAALEAHRSKTLLEIFKDDPPAACGATIHDNVQYKGYHLDSTVEDVRREALATNELVNEIIDAYNAFLEAHKNDVPDAAERTREVNEEANEGRNRTIKQMDELFADLPAYKRNHMTCRMNA